MNQFDLLAVNKTIKEYRTESRWSYSRRIDRALRNVCPKDESWQMVALFAVLAIAFCVMFVRWWVCA